MPRLKLTPEQKQLMLDAGNTSNPRVAYAATEQLSMALSLPLRQGILPGDIISDIFSEEEASMTGNSTVEYPLDFVEPGTEGFYTAHTIPYNDGVPYTVSHGDYLQVPLYDIAAAQDFDVKYLRHARWDVMARAAEVVNAKITTKQNDDGFHTLISGGADRGIMVADPDATAGNFSTRLVSMAKTTMSRNGGGNTSSVNRFALTDLFLSLEAFEDIRSWNVDQIDEFTRREIYTMKDGLINRVYSVNLRDLVELGEGQKYQLFYEEVLNGTMPTAGDQKVELAVGLDLTKDVYIMPVSEEFSINFDDTQRRQRKVGLWGTKCLGFGVLDTRGILLLAI